MAETNYSHDDLATFFVEKLKEGVGQTEALVLTAMHEKKLKDPYHELRRILEDAIRVGAAGKGEARHGVVSEQWDKQPIISIQELLQNSGFALGQTIKKCQEASHFDDPQQAINELYGAIVYVAGAIKFLEKVRDEQK